MDSEKPLISVIIPVYNGHSTIDRTLLSVLRQTYSELEILIVDDGSTDQTAEIAAQHAARDGRIRLIQKDNGGVASARNVGITAASGSFIAFLDADDLWHPAKLERQIETFATSASSVALVYCRYREIDDDDNVVDSPLLTLSRGDAYGAILLANNMGGGSAAMVRRDLLGNIRFDETLVARGAQGAEDTKFFLDVAEAHDIDYADEFLMGYRRSLGSMSRQSEPMWRSLQIVVEHARSRRGDLPPRLFRWARGECLHWLTIDALEAGQFNVGLRMALRGLTTDPKSILNPAIARAALYGIRRTKQRAQQIAAASLRDLNSFGRRNFFDYDRLEALRPNPAPVSRYHKRLALALATGTKDHGGEKSASA